MLDLHGGLSCVAAGPHALEKKRKQSRRQDQETEMARHTSESFPILLNSQPPLNRFKYLLMIRMFLPFFFKNCLTSLSSLQERLGWVSSLTLQAGLCHSESHLSVSGDVNAVRL